MILGNVSYLEGNITKDVEVRTTPKGTKVATMTLAVISGHSDQVSFLDVVLFNELAEEAGEKGTKGTFAKVFGHQQRRSYEDKNGVKRYVNETVADLTKYVQPNRPLKQHEVLDHVLTPEEEDEIEIPF